MRNVLCNFQKNFPLPKNGGHFEFLAKMAKHKLASISLTVQDRAILSKSSTHRVSEQCTLGNFQKIFPSPKMAAILYFRIFCQKMEKCKLASISLTVQDRAISSKYSTHRVSEQCTLGNFQKIFPSPKMAAILYFRIFCQKMEKSKLASISLTVQDRAISSKYSTHRVSEKCTLDIFKKFSSPQKWRPFCIFECLPKMAKHKFASISLTVRDRAISSKFSTHRVSKQCTLGYFQKIFLSPKMAAILYFRMFAKNGKTQICFYLLNRAR